MSSTSRAWIEAASVGAAQAMKDQGLCRWNQTMRSMHQHANNKLRSLAQTRQLSSAVASSCKTKDQEKLKESEESLRKVMYLSCWGPN